MHKSSSTKAPASKGKALSVKRSESESKHGEDNYGEVESNAYTVNDKS